MKIDIKLVAHAWWQPVGFSKNFDLGDVTHPPRVLIFDNQAYLYSQTTFPSPEANALVIYQLTSYIKLTDIEKGDKT